MTSTLTWDDAIGIVAALIKEHPGVNLEQISLNTIFQWIVDLPDFSDDHELGNEQILNSILQEWYEVVNPI